MERHITAGLALFTAAACRPCASRAPLIRIFRPYGARPQNDVYPGLTPAYARGYIQSLLRGSIRMRLRRDIGFENSCHPNRNLDKYDRQRELLMTARTDVLGT